MNKQSLNRGYRQPYKQPKKPRTNLSNMGTAFEQHIIYSNNQYFHKDMAYIEKVDTPVQITQKFQNGTISGRLKKSTVDFLGALKSGKMVAFDTKSTIHPTSFPLKNIEIHQYKILEKYHSMNAYSFILLEWVHYHEYYVIPFESLKRYWESAEKGGRKSIPYKEMEQAFKVPTGTRGIVIDYLAPFGNF